MKKQSTYKAIEKVTKEKNWSIFSCLIESRESSQLLIAYIHMVKTSEYNHCCRDIIQDKKNNNCVLRGKMYFSMSMA